MAYFDGSGELGSAARALRLALIIFPVAAVFLSVIRVVQSAELLQTQWGHSLVFLIAHYALYPLLYLAFGLWAAHVIRPSEFFKILKSLPDPKVIFSDKNAAPLLAFTVAGLEDFGRLYFRPMRFLLVSSYFCE